MANVAQNNAAIPNWRFFDVATGVAESFAFISFDGSTAVAVSGVVDSNDPDCSSVLSFEFNRFSNVSFFGRSLIVMKTVV